MLLLPKASKTCELGYDYIMCAGEPYSLYLSLVYRALDTLAEPSLLGFALALSV